MTELHHIWNFYVEVVKDINFNGTASHLDFLYRSTEFEVKFYRTASHLDFLRRSSKFEVKFNGNASHLDFLYTLSLFYKQRSDWKTSQPLKNFDSRCLTVAYFWSKILDSRCLFFLCKQHIKCEKIKMQ